MTLFSLTGKVAEKVVEVRAAISARYYEKWARRLNSKLLQVLSATWQMVRMAIRCPCAPGLERIQRKRSAVLVRRQLTSTKGTGNKTAQSTLRGLIVR
jgi:hypothetical protein